MARPGELPLQPSGSSSGAELSADGRSLWPPRDPIINLTPEPQPLRQMQAHSVALARNTSDALARARYLCGAAHRVVDEAETLYKAAEQSTAAARHVRSDCQHLRELWTDLQASSTGLVVRCAYCKRIRAHDGDWFGVGASIDHILQRVNVLVVSHGICADCAALYLRSAGVAERDPAALPSG